jgi:hypothetical protein
MAGKKVRNYLKARGFNGFYDLYHGLSEQVGSSSLSIVGYAEIIRLLHKEDPDILSNVKACSELDECVARSKEAAQQIHGFFWPQVNNEDIKDVNLKLKSRLRRWEPFDEAAWDSMFHQMTAILGTSLQSVWICYEKVKAYPTRQSGNSEKIQNMLTTFEKYWDDLSKMRDQSRVEFDIFNNWFLSRLRQAGHTIVAVLGIIQRSIEGTVVPVEFRTVLDESIASTRVLETLAELFKNPGTIERMLLDKDLLARRTLPRDEVAWDSIWAEMAGVMRVSVGKSRDNLQKMKLCLPDPVFESHKISDEFTRIEKSLDDFSNILLEMIDQSPLTNPPSDRT